MATTVGPAHCGLVRVGMCAVPGVKETCRELDLMAA